LLSSISYSKQTVDRLDNLAPDALKAAAKILKGLFPHALIEGSGGITEETIGSYMSPGLPVVVLLYHLHFTETLFLLLQMSTFSAHQVFIRGLCT
jgi:nicotinate-nucleotide pyrophosphorylase